MKQLEMEHDVDPRQKILDAVGDLSNVEMFNNQALVAVYVRPEKTKSGLYLSDKYRDEDRFQSKIGLLLATGPKAFSVESDEWFNGVAINHGDWLVFRPSDGWNVTVNGVLCRMLSDVQVKARVDTPDRMW